MNPTKTKELQKYSLIWSYAVKCHFQQYFSYIMSVCFIGGGNQSTQGKTNNWSQVADKLYHIMLYQVHYVYA